MKTFHRLLTLAALTLGLSGAALAELPLRMAYVAPQPVWGPSADRYAQELAQRTGNEIKIQSVLPLTADT